MVSKIRLCGIYNRESLEIALNHKIHNITFDFRPTSLNFIPLHSCLEIIEEFSLSSVRLLFGDDSPFVISEILRNISTSTVDVELEFDQVRDPSFYKEIGASFTSNVATFKEMEALLQNPFFEGGILDDALLQELQKNGELASYFRNLTDLMAKYDRRDLKFDLKINWRNNLGIDTKLIPNFQNVILLLSPVVEKSYRVINEQTFNDRLKSIESLVNQLES